jgi:hypothetical protein
MKLNQKFKLRGQRYTCIGHRPHEMSNGRWIELVRLKSTCPDCGATFRVLASKTRILRRNINRRCEDCHQPGVPVRPRRRRAPAVTAKLTKLRLARRLERWRSVGTATAVSAPALATAVDLAVPGNKPQGSAAARIADPAAVESASVLSAAAIAERAEQEAILDSYMRRLGML